MIFVVGIVRGLCTLGINMNWLIINHNKNMRIVLFSLSCINVFFDSFCGFLLVRCLSILFQTESCLFVVVVVMVSEKCMVHVCMLQNERSLHYVTSCEEIRFGTFQINVRFHVQQRTEPNLTASLNFNFNILTTVRRYVLSEHNLTPNSLIAVLNFCWKLLCSSQDKSCRSLRLYGLN